MIFHKLVYLFSYFIVSATCFSWKHFKFIISLESTTSFTITKMLLLFSDLHTSKNDLLSYDR